MLYQVIFLIYCVSSIEKSIRFNVGISAFCFSEWLTGFVFSFPKNFPFKISKFRSMHALGHRFDLPMIIHFCFF